MFSVQTLARCCAAEYQPPSRETWRTVWGDDLISYNEVAVGGHHCTVLLLWVPEHRKKVSLVVNRGTEREFSDIVTDMRTYPWYSKDFGIHHRGFGLAARELWAAGLDDLLGTETLHKRDIILTGHSLGGAMALFQAALMLKANQRPVSVVTFGAPRVGLPWLGVADLQARLQNEIILQYVNGDDIVSRVPSLLPGWRHGASEKSFLYSRPHAFHNHRISEYVAALGDEGRISGRHLIDVN